MPFDRIKRIEQEMAMYKKDKNKERLVDAANMLLLEFEEGDGEFKPTDEGGIKTETI